ncbi:MAG: choice-of-anchor B family protein [Chloroflexota bacterium]|nr:MAG: choice-of-anchor B family protein [Chloroflexota bacterium]
MKYIRIPVIVILMVTLLLTGTAFAHEDEDSPEIDHLANPLALIMADDGVSSLPVFKGPFPDTANMVFHSQLSPDDLGALPLPGVWVKGMMNDLWGWTSPAGEEYALATNSGGIAVVRVTDPANPVYLGKIQSQSPANFGNIWGDPATFGNYAYFVTEIVGSSVIILDMSGLDALGPASSPDSILPAPVTFFNGGGYLGSHNVRINEASGFAYLAGVRLASNNACGNTTPPDFNTLILDLNTDPTNPDVIACLQNVGEHDFYVVNYTGPDTDHQGKEIAFVFDGRDRTGAAIGGFTEIWDVTDKANIVQLARFRLPGLVFSHNGWTTDEQDFLFIGDELDELVLAGWAFTPLFAQPPVETTNKPQTGTYIVDVSDLDNPVFVERYEDGTVGLDHNFVVEDNKLIIASYTSGTRVLEINRDSEGNVSLSPFAHMDTEPRLQENILNIKQQENFGSAFLGQWGIYAFPNSDTIIASDLNNGLVVMSLSDEPCFGMKCSLE